MFGNSATPRCLTLRGVEIHRARNSIQRRRHFSRLLKVAWMGRFMEVRDTTSLVSLLSQALSYSTHERIVSN